MGLCPEASAEPSLFLGRLCRKALLAEGKPVPEAHRRGAERRLQDLLQRAWHRVSPLLQVPT